MRGLTVALVLLAVAPPCRAEGPGFVPGEGLTFDLSVGPIPAGRARMSVGLPEVRKGRRVAAMQGEAKSAEWLRLFARLDDTYKVVFDAATLAPAKVSCVEQGIRERSIVADLDGRRMVLDYASPKEAYRRERLLPGPARDPVTALFALRAAALTDGEAISMLVVDGFALYRAEGQVVGREALPRPEGSVATVRIDIEARRIDDQGLWDGQTVRRVKIWLSDDQRRIPYRLVGDTDLGPAQVELTSYTAPAPKRPALRLAVRR